MPDIFHYAGEANPKDIRLSDPTALRGGAATTGTGAITASASTLSATGILQFIGSASLTESASTLSAVGTLNFSGSSALTESVSILAANGNLSFTGSSSILQSVELIEAQGQLSFIGSSAIIESAATLDASGALPVAGVTGAGTMQAAAALLQGVGSVVPLIVAIPIALNGRPSPFNNPKPVSGSAELIASAGYLDAQGLVLASVNGAAIVFTSYPRIMAEGSMNTDEVDIALLLATI